MRGEQNDAKRQQELRCLCGEVREEIENGLSCREQRSATSFADLSKMINEFAHLQNASPTGEPEFLRYLARQDGVRQYRIFIRSALMDFFVWWHIVLIAIDFIFTRLDLRKTNPQLIANEENQDCAQRGKNEAGGMISFVCRARKHMANAATDDRSDDAEHDRPEERYVHVHH
jgi:hypothetical protein